MLRGKIPHFRLTCVAQKRRCLSSLLADVFSLSSVTVSEVFVSSFLSISKVAIMVSFQAWSTTVWQSNMAEISSHGSPHNRVLLDQTNHNFSGLYVEIKIFKKNQ